MAQHAENPAAVDRLVEQATELAPDDRDAFLDTHCAGQPELRAAVEEQLEVLDASERYFERLRQELGMPEAGGGDRWAGQTIGPYTLKHLLGEGGMGAVYLAERTTPYEQLVALKILPGGQWLRRWHERFVRERQMLAGLKHPHICRLLDGGVSEAGVPYLVMEWVDGEPMDHYCRRHELDPAATVQLFLKLLGAVAYAHGEGVIHRDLKPANVLVAKGGDVQVVDFGIARIHTDEGTSTEATGAALLTPAYASPERLRGEPTTVACDIYALGVMLYQLLAGRLPFDLTGRSPAEMERLVSDTDPPRPSRAGPGAPAEGGMSAGDLDAVVARMMSRDPQRRYARVEDAAADLENLLAHRPVSARAPTLRYRAARFVRRHRVPVMLGLVTGASLIGAAVLGVTLALEAREQARIAAQERDRAQAASGFLVGLFEDLDPNANPLDTPARKLLAQGTEDLERLDNAVLKQEMLGTVSGVYRVLREYDLARRLLEQEFALARSGGDSQRAADVLTRLASTQLAQGEYEAALASVDEALAQLNDLEAPAIRAGALLVRGQTLHRQGELTSARSAYEAALPLAMRYPGADEEFLSRLQTEMANLANHTGREDEAVALFHTVLERRIRIHGEYSTPVSSTLLGLAQTRRSQGAVHEAIELLEQANAINQQLLGPDNDRHAFVLNSLGRAYESLEDYPAAERHYREALRLIVLFRGTAHPNVGFASGNVAKSLAKQKQWAAAAEFFERAVAITQTHRPNHIAVHDMRWNLGRALMKAGDLAAAEGPLLAGLEALAQQYGDSHPSARGALRAAVELYEQRGNPTQAALFQARLKEPGTTPGETQAPANP